MKSSEDHTIGCLGISWFGGLVWITGVILSNYFAFGSSLEEKVPEAVANILMVAFLALPVALAVHVLITLKWIFTGVRGIGSVGAAPLTWLIGITTLIEIVLVAVLYVRVSSILNFG